MTPDDDKKIIKILSEKDTQVTRVFLKDGTEFVVYNIAWGYDIGEEYAHITTNISPDVEGASIDFFHSNQISKIVNEETEQVVFET